MSQIVVARPLGAYARDWVTQALRRGHDLSRAMLPYVETGRGAVFAHVPRDASDADVSRLGSAVFATLGWGGKAAAQSQDSAIASVAAAGAQTLVLETSIPSAKLAEYHVDERVFPRTTAILGTTVLFWRALEEVSTSAPQFLGALGGYDNAFAIRGSVRANDELIKGDWVAVARRVMAILVPAYDEESYLVWLRQ